MKTIKKIAGLLMALAIVATTIVSTSLDAQAKGNTSSSVAIAAAVIQDGNVVVTSSGTVASEDGLYHLVASDVYAGATAGTDVCQVAASAAATFAFPLNANTESSMLYKKFTVCVLKSGALTAVSNSMFITNPDAIGSHAVPRMDNGKKGLLADASSANMGMRSLATLGAKQATVTLELSKISNGRGTPYTYNGKTYNFNTGYISAYDNLLGRLNSQGVQVSLILVADANAKTEFLSPYSYDGLGAHTYYGLNAANADGAELLAAAGSFLANRWMGFSYHSMNARVDNFIIGNEVNAWYEWNYMNTGSKANYIKQYSDAFRILYTAIKSTNANANVYVCTDNQWGFDQTKVYGARDFLTQFNQNIAGTGNIDWRLAFHAYNYPMTDTTAWAANKNIQRSQNTRFVSVYNIDVVTDFLSQPSMLSPTGAVRTVKLSEQGYTSSVSQEYQAAAITYAILVANNNSHVDGIIISREKDDPYIEIPQGLALGLMTTDNHAKLAYDYYMHAEEADYIAQAGALVGVDFYSTLAPR